MSRWVSRASPGSCASRRGHRSRGSCRIRRPAPPARCERVAAVRRRKSRDSLDSGANPAQGQRAPRAAPTDAGIGQPVEIGWVRVWSPISCPRPRSLASTPGTARHHVRSGKTSPEPSSRAAFAAAARGNGVRPSSKVSATNRFAAARRVRGGRQRRLPAPPATARRRQRRPHGAARRPAAAGRSTSAIAATLLADAHAERKPPVPRRNQGASGQGACGVVDVGGAATACACAKSLPTITVTIARGPGVASVAGDTFAPGRPRSARTRARRRADPWPPAEPRSRRS